MSANRCRKARNVFSNQVDMLIDWRRIRTLLSIHLAAIHLLTGLSLRYKEWSPMRGYYGLIQEDTMVLHERILWSHTRGYYGLIREDTMVSYEKILWSHIRGYYGLT
ncbi:hypothetical protein CS548_02045 [Porphyromonas gingivalis]|nr:hypothetical protein CS548_02045 [Porphyromonas gingivalis]